VLSEHAISSPCGSARPATPQVVDLARGKKICGSLRPNPKAAS